AVFFFSSSESSSDLRSTPISTLSLANSKSYISTALRFGRAAASAASLTILARSAPEKPGVPRARTDKSTSSARGILRVWTRRISSRPRTSGRFTTTRRIKPIGAIRRRHQDHAVVRFEAVHFHQQLVQSLLTLIVSTAEASAAVTPNGVNLI